MKDKMLGDMQRYEEATGMRCGFTVHELIPVGLFHWTAWVEYGDSSPRPAHVPPERELLCECNLQEGVGWYRSERHGGVNIRHDLSDRCPARMAAAFYQRMTLRQMYLKRFLKGTTLLTNAVPLIYVRAVMDDLVKRAITGEFVGEDKSHHWPGPALFSLRVVADIMGQDLQLVQMVAGMNTSSEYCLYGEMYVYGNTSRDKTVAETASQQALPS